MHHIRTRILGAVVIATLITAPLAALPLSRIVDEAFAKSAKMRDLELTKTDTLLTISRNQAEDGVGVTVSGDLKTTVNFDTSSTSLTSSGIAATIALPDDGNTTIKVSTGTLSYNTNKNTYSFAPAVGASHTFTYGLTDDNRKSLTNRQTELLATSTYELNRLNFTTSLYTQIGAILDNEKNIKRTTKELNDLQRTLEQNLTLQIVRKDSLIYRASEQAIKSKQTALEGLERSKELYLSQFRNLAGFDWDGVESIGEPTLLFTANPAANSSLKLKKLAVDLAKEELALLKAVYTNKSLVVGGSAEFVSAKTIAGYSNAITAAGSAALAGNQYKLSGSISATYDIDGNTFTPTLTIGGSWSNNPSSYSEGLKIQQAENKVLTAELAYQSAVDEYNQNAATLESSIASYLMNHALLVQSIEYNRQTLEQQEELYRRGLATAEQVADARFAVEIDAYALDASLLEGLKLENQIKSLGL